MTYLPFLKVPGWAALWAIMFVLKIVVAALGLFVVPFMYKYRDSDYRSLPVWTELFSNIEDWTGQPNSWHSSLPKWWIEAKVKKEYMNWYDRPLNTIKKGLTMLLNVFGRAAPDWQFQGYILLPRGTGFFSFYHYYAIRNAANGLRAIDPIRLSIDWDRVGYLSSLSSHFSLDSLSESYGTYEPEPLRRDGRKWAGYIAWQGWYAGMKVVYIWNKDRHLVIKIGWRIEPADVNPLPEGESHEFYTTQAVLRNNRSFAMKVGLYRRG